MSKRLTDEALSYFDECVSISTFDSSDFSAAEDPSVNSAAITPPKRAAADPNHIIDQQKINGDPGSSSVTNSSSNEVLIDNTECDKKCRFSFGHKLNEGVELQHDLKTYIKTFEKDKGTNGIFLERSRENYNVDAYNLLVVNESLLFDKVFYKNRQESGSLHICGRIDVPFLPLDQLF
ncbi:uncharacterized protein [Rutidosis leptorrhynchoides]|uniref:uncharacterized protein n=1 Tax=Rutidosis leptorrhynchoides TaxID=125765 RepID=UPI003A9A190B